LAHSPSHSFSLNLLGSFAFPLFFCGSGRPARLPTLPQRMSSARSAHSFISKSLNNVFSTKRKTFFQSVSRKQRTFLKLINRLLLTSFFWLRDIFSWFSTGAGNSVFDWVPRRLDSRSDRMWPHPIRSRIQDLSSILFSIVSITIFIFPTIRY
jgi:hypothetical protein